MNETNLEIKVFGNSKLRKKAKFLKQVTDEERNILSKMAQLMYDSGGIGLAATQVGIDKALAVVDVGDGLYKLVNPRIIKKEGVQDLEEGCLSVPNIYVKVKRAQKVEVSALTETGTPITIKAEGLFACCLQQEIDHLNGKLIIDYLPLPKRLLLRLKKMIGQNQKRN